MDEGTINSTAASSDLRSGEAGRIASDTPIHRTTINQLSVVELETALDELRERRLAARQAIERAAKVKTEKADVSAFLRFEKLLKLAKKAQDKLDADAAKQEATVHKLRALIIEMGVG